MAELVGGTLGLGVGLLWIVALVLLMFWPLMAWSAMRSLKGIRRELERMNDHMDKRAFVEAPPREYTKMGTLVTR